MYTTTTIKHKRTDALDALARSGRCYSKTVSLLRKTHPIPSEILETPRISVHSQSVQACVPRTSRNRMIALGIEDT